MILVTGAAGFIGSNIIQSLNKQGREDIIAVDFFDNCPPLLKNNPSYLDKLKIHQKVNACSLFYDTSIKYEKIEGIIHMGACSDTTCTNEEFMLTMNYYYTKNLWVFCASRGIPLIYASSAATYGDGSSGYNDEKDMIYKPLNIYGKSKQKFDIWALNQSGKPSKWAALKFFNVYGPNEGHKGRMASVAFHAFNQINKEGIVRLFKSNNPIYEDGCQKRDFIYVDDVVDAVLHFYNNEFESGIYNVGTGNARTFNDLANSIFAALKMEPNIEYIDMPFDIQDKYQYFTESTTEKLRKSGFNKEFTSLEKGCEKYINFLIE